MMIKCNDRPIRDFKMLLQQRTKNVNIIFRRVARAWRIEEIQVSGGGGGKFFTVSN